MSILLPLDVQVSLKTNVETILRRTWLYQYRRDGIHSVLSALPPEHLHVWPDNETSRRQRDLQARPYNLNVIGADEVCGSKIRSLWKECVERTERAMAGVVIAARYTGIDCCAILRLAGATGECISSVGGDCPCSDWPLPECPELKGGFRIVIPSMSSICESNTNRLSLLAPGSGLEG